MRCPLMTKADTPILQAPFYRLAGDLELKFFVRSGATAAALVIYGALVIVSSAPHLQER